MAPFIIECGQEGCPVKAVLSDTPSTREVEAVINTLATHANEEGKRIVVAAWSLRSLRRLEKIIVLLVLELNGYRQKGQAGQVQVKK